MPRSSDWRPSTASRLATLVTLATLAWTGGALLFACASAPGEGAKQRRSPVDPGPDFVGEEGPPEEGLSPISTTDSGAFGVPKRPSGGRARDGGAPADGGHVVDGGHAEGGGPLDKAYCAGPLKRGDLEMGELLIAARAGEGDRGEWVEVRSTRTCWLKLKGLVIASPRGAAMPDSVTTGDDFELGPQQRFIVADSADPLKNNRLPGKVFAWESFDVLDNAGDTVSLKVGATVVDTLTYPAFPNLEPGRTVAFPDDCPGPARSDWARWSQTFAAWAPGFQGTPNATNTDVACY